VLDIRVPGSDEIKVYICHVPPGLPGNPQTLAVSVSAVPAHIPGHPNDHLGKCNQSCDDLEFKAGGLAGELITSETSGFNVIVFPNPFLNEITLTIESEDPAKCMVNVYDMSGNTVIKNNNLLPGDPFIFGPDLNNGIYLVYVRQVNQVHIIKIVKND
jgi:hypothetical protein